MAASCFSFRLVSSTKIQIILVIFVIVIFVVSKRNTKHWLCATQSCLLTTLVVQVEQLAQCLCMWT